MYKHIFESLIDNITQHYGIPIAQMFSKNKDYESVEPRHMFFYLCNTKNIPTITIQRHLDSLGYSIHHSSILRGIAKINDKVTEVKDFDPLISKLENVTSNVQ